MKFNVQYRFPGAGWTTPVEKDFPEEFDAHEWRADELEAAQVAANPFKNMTIQEGREGL